jgi:hypothetical protein
MRPISLNRGTLALLLAAAAACDTSSSKSDGGASDAGCSTAGLCAADPGFTQTAPNTPNSIGVTFSGETLGISGLPYTPVTMGDPLFVDGWTVTVDEYLTVVGNIRLNENPLKDQTWQDMDQVVAIKHGPYVFDAHRAAGFVGKDGVELASAMFYWTHKDDDSAFDTSKRYAFSYDTVVASYPAAQINLEPSQFADYDKMVQNHWDKLIKVTATHVASGSYSNPTNPGTGAAAQANFAKFPTAVHVVFGVNDATPHLNCINATLGDAASLANRGVQTLPGGMAIAQITQHVDHVFWDKLVIEGTPLRFDPIAAWAPQDTSVTPFDLNSFHSQHLATTFQDGTPLPDRGPFMTGNGIPFTTDQTNGGGQVIMDPNGVTSVPDDYVDFMAFSLQSQMHLNANGLCYVVGQHANDPFFAPNVQPAH